jgi:hypothetical protein
MIEIAHANESLSFTLSEKVTDKNIQAVLQRIYNRAGCRGCGLLGFDVHLHVINPATRAEFGEVEGLVDVRTLGVRS